jgi:hypothetical protein
MTVYELGETYIGKIYIYDESGNLYDPTSADMRITKPDGTAVDPINMSSKATGVYYGDWDIPEDGDFGVYEVKFKIADDEIGTTFQREQFFVLPIDVDEVREMSGDASIEDDDLARIVYYAQSIAESDTGMALKTAKGESLKQLKMAVIYMAAHLCRVKLTEPKRLTLADVESNREKFILDLDKGTILRIYKNIVHRLSIPFAKGSSLDED